MNKRQRKKQAKRKKLGTEGVDYFKVDLSWVEEPRIKGALKLLAEEKAGAKG
ncbi:MULTISPECIES: hypothetical protein [Listeria]|uniref:hypothetical protein n=1 Tax=Listeria TaxID=1637 RepID=UPI00016950D5|nr:MULTISPECIES: hypothetical protein [Listeria]EHV9032234.1 hypothetical protein [Listeria monocytogenes]EHZ6176346.1 hypothetical protein [Listeria monocytogenes]EIB3905727.1 hypothetical protein [Listeria monocytogenes]EIB3908697.1 hypothetical protein [Listeria monocytogenes]EII2483121.1 hypothetical protein [Listeria monocytogenes]